MIKKHIQRTFNKAAKTYAQASVLYRTVGERLLSRLNYMRCEPQIILDAGSGLGHFSRELMYRYPAAQVVALDFSENMIHEGNQANEVLCLVGDMEDLPLKSASVEMIFANQSLQDVIDMPRVMSEFHRVLKPNGVLLFSTFGPDTLKELKAAWACIDTYGHINEWRDLHLWGDALLSQQFIQPVVDREEIVVHYSHPRALLKDLKDQGSYTLHPLRRKGLMGIDAFEYLLEVLAQQKQENGKIPLTYEIVYGHAWRGENRSYTNKNTGETVVTLDKIRRLT